MYDSFMMGCLGGFGGYDDELDPDEHQDLLMRLAACMPLYKCDTFEDTLDNACYVCNVELESLTEEDIDWLREMTEEE